MGESTVRNDSHSDYHAIKNKARRSMYDGVWAQRFKKRFVPFSSRELRCDMPREAIDCMSEGKHYISYRGIPMAKDPLDMALYEILLFELKPRTIIELGSYTGASAVWMSDTLKTFDVEAEVISVDIDLTLVDQEAWRQEHVHFIEGDCHEISEIFPAEKLGQFAHPLVLIDDAHVNITGVYEHFHQHGFRSGDYLIVEDTIPWIPGTFGTQEEETDWGEWKWREIQEFFDRHDQTYRIDRYYTDFFGYNGTWNWNGFVKRI